MEPNSKVVLDFNYRETFIVVLKNACIWSMI